MCEFSVLYLLLTLCKLLSALYTYFLLSYFRCSHIMCFTGKFPGKVFVLKMFFFVYSVTVVVPETCISETMLTSSNLINLRRQKAVLHVLIRPLFWVLFFSFSFLFVCFPIPDVFDFQVLVRFRHL